jgi:hypothetical protein
VKKQLLAAAFAAAALAAAGLSNAQPSTSRDITKDLPLFLAEAENCIRDRNACRGVERQEKKNTSGGACLWVQSGGELVMSVVIHQPRPHYVYLRCPANQPSRAIKVQLGDIVASEIRLTKDMGDPWHWARVGPFEMTEKSVNCPLILKPTTAYSFNVDLVAVTPSPILPRRDGAQENFEDLTYWKLPGPEVLKGLLGLRTEPTAYKMKKYIVQAPPERIHMAVGYVKYIETEIYPTLKEILGYAPPIDLHAVVFTEQAKVWSIYKGIGEFQNTGLQASQIFLRARLLDRMPPFGATGGVTWETIQAFLNHPKNQADWKDVWEPGVLSVVYEMELSRRLKLDWDFDARWKRYVTDKPGSRYAAYCEFWKEYGWGPYQKFLLKLHENPDFKPVLTESSLVYELSLGAGKDVSPFFIERGWTVDDETRAKIKAEVEGESPSR